MERLFSEKLSSIEIKNKFLSFFKERGHMEITNSSIIPKNDPTLLFINSGMAPIKNYFTGVEKPPCPRLCDIQSCIRTIDIDSVGDKHHLTSFQMLGSWSINDYFKEKAIALAFEFLTKYLNIPKEKLYVTVFSGDKDLDLPLDEEAYEYWKKVGMPEDHIVKCGKEDNFWGPTAETGPCGPCTEIFYDTGEGLKYVPGGEFDTKKRYIEIWNAGVFMQLNKNADGTFSRLSFTSVDTGAGLERIAMVLGGYSTVYDTDLLNPIKKFIESNIPSGSSICAKDILIMTDHLRTATLILSEKVSPSNEGRGYIPRKLLRRCMMITAKNKIWDFDFSGVANFIIEKYSELFANFSKNKNYIIDEFKKEQEQFGKVLKNGLERLEQIKLSSKNISSDEAFELVTTYGLPFDIICGYAEENGMNVDKKGFENKINEHKEKSKNVHGSSENANLKNILKQFEDCKATEFVGYDISECQCNVLKVLKEDENVYIALDKTPFYAEFGGQCADTGAVFGENCDIKIEDVKKLSNGTFVHIGKIISGNIENSPAVTAKIDMNRRKKIANNHSAVHLLQSALQKVYGKNLHQAGSKVEENKLRFDFNYDNTLSEEEIFEIEKIVNGYIRDNLARNVEIKKLSDAISDGATALFENKYGDNVRVVSFGEVSKELCGGTHTDRTGNIGLFCVLSAEGIGKGIKRITAVTGDEALTYIQNKVKDLNELARILKVKPEMAAEKAKKELLERSNKKPEVKSVSKEDIKYIGNCSGLKIGYIRVQEHYKKLSSDIAKISDEVGCVVVCLSGDDKKQVIVAVSDDMMPKHFANDILKSIMEKIGGKGGGNKKLATGGCKASENQVLDAITSIHM